MLVLGLTQELFFWACLFEIQASHFLLLWLIVSYLLSRDLTTVGKPAQATMGYITPEHLTGKISICQPLFLLFCFLSFCCLQVANRQPCPLYINVGPMRTRHLPMQSNIYL